MMQTYGLFGSTDELIQKVQRDFPGTDIFVDKELAFYDYLIPGLESKNEICTIRFKKDMIRIPGVRNGMIPWVVIKPDDSSHGQQIGHVCLGMLVVARVKDFPERIVRLDEYNTKEEMVKDISRIYQHPLQPDDMLSGYLIAELNRQD